VARGGGGGGVGKIGGLSLYGSVDVGKGGESQSQIKSAKKKRMGGGGKICEVKCGSLLREFCKIATLLEENNQKPGDDKELRPRLKQRPHYQTASSPRQQKEKKLTDKRQVVA